MRLEVILSANPDGARGLVAGPVEGALTASARGTPAYIRKDRGVRWGA
jgi:hypothetical protein